MAHYTEVILSDGRGCEVRRLGIFELDGMGPELTGPYVYTMKMSNGEVVEDIYDLSRYSSPPAHPGVPEDQIVERSPTWYQLIEWQTYKAALVHEYKERLPSIAAYVREMSSVITRKCLRNPADADRIVEESDWLKILEAAIVPPLTPEVIAHSFKTNFSARWGQQEILDAVYAIADRTSPGKHDTLRAWEVQVMNMMGMTQEKWYDLGVEERAWRVAGHFVSEIMSSLESNRQIENAKRNR